MSLDRLEEAKSTIDQALAHKLDGEALRGDMYELAFLRGDSAQMEQQLAWVAGKPEEATLLSMQSDTEAYYGRMGKAREFSRRAVDSAVRADSKETAAYWEVNAALREAELGNAELARQGVARALALSPGRDVKVLAALTLARTSDAVRAKPLVEELGRTYSTNTLMKLYWLPTINGAIEAGKNNSSQALVDLEPAVPYELGWGGSFINYLYPAYVRGQAYLAMGDASKAAGEFQKFIDHPGVVLNSPLGAVARLRRARAYARVRAHQRGQDASQSGPTGRSCRRRKAEGRNPGGNATEPVSARRKYGACLARQRAAGCHLQLPFPLPCD